MAAWPTPANDTGIGVHSDPNAYYKPADPYQYADDLYSHGVRWFLHWYYDEGAVDFIRIMRQRGIEVIGRPGPAKMPRPAIDIAVVEAYIAAGVRWFILGNEYNLNEEWTTDWRQFDKPVRMVADQFIRYADAIRERGAWCLTPPPSLGGHMLHRDWFTRFLTALANIANERGQTMDELLHHCGIGIHCRSVGNPLEDGPEDYDCSAREWEWFAAQVKQYVGHSLPMANTEAFDEPQWLPKVGNDYDWDLWKSRNLEQMRWFDPNNPGQRYPKHVIANCHWVIHADRFSPWPQCGLIGNYTHFVQRGDYITDLWRAMPGAITWTRDDEPEPGPEPGPGPPPLPEPEPIPIPDVKMRAYLKDGTEVEPESLLATYAVTIERCDDSGFRVMEIRERCEAANCDVWVKDVMGNPMASKEVRWGWPGTEIVQLTDPYGRVGFAMSPDAYYDPAVGGGPHWTAVFGNSDVVRGIGMIPGTVHCTLNFIFQYGEAPEPEPEPLPEPEPEPEPEPMPEVGYSLLGGLERLGLAVEDYREQVKAVSLTNEISTRPFGKINGIVIHHTGSNAAQTPMGIVDYHIKTRGFPTIGYHFIIGWEGQVYFMAPLAWVTPHCGYLNAETIGIAVMGDFTGDWPSNQQLEALRLLIYGLQEFLGQGWGKDRRCYVLPHSYLAYLDAQGNYGRSECPGKLKEALVWAGEWPGRSV